MVRCICALTSDVSTPACPHCLCAAQEAADEDEIEDFTIRPTDNLILVGQSEDEHSRVEVYVYEEAENNYYVHHDVLVGGMPLCLEWLDYDPAQPETPGTCFGSNAGLIWSRAAVLESTIVGEAGRGVVHFSLNRARVRVGLATRRLTLTTCARAPRISASTGNLVAVGTMLPTIDIWDLDIVDGLEPVCTLGVMPEIDEMAPKKKGMLVWWF